MSILGFIPARLGSKGLPDKNFKNFIGKPLVHYTLKLAKELGEVVYPFLSSNDPRIIEYAKKLGYDSEYIRPNILSSDTSSVVDAVIHGLEFLENFKGKKFDSVILLQPTSPLRLYSDVKSAILNFRDNDYSSLASVCKMKEHPRECISLKEDNQWEYLVRNSEKVFNRQNYKDNYAFLDGSFYIAKVGFLKKNNRFVIENETKLFWIDSKYTIDIDYLEDFEFAEYLYQKRHYRTFE